MSAQNSGRAAAAAKLRKKMPEGRRFPKGKSGNPGGRPSTKWMRDYLAEMATARGDVSRRQAIAQALFMTSIDREHKDHVRAGELLLAYEMGKPVQAVEVSGPEGSPVDALATMTTEKRNARLRELLAKATAGAPPGPPGSDNGQSG